MSKLSSDFSEWKLDVYEDLKDEDWMRDVKLDASNNKFTCMVDLTFQDTFIPLTVAIPKNYPDDNKYIVECSNLKDVKEIKAEDLVDCLRKVQQHCEELRDEIMNTIVTPTPKDVTPFVSETTQQIGFWGDDKQEDDEEAKKIETQIQNDLKSIKEKDGWYGKQGPYGSNQCWVYLFFDTKLLQISELIAGAWGLNPKKFVTVALKFPSQYTQATTPPEIFSYQSGDISKGLDGTELNDKEPYTLSWTVINRLQQEFFDKFWPLSKYIETKPEHNYVYVLLELIQDTLKECPKRCAICNDDLPYEGIKPTVCGKQLCIFSHEQYSIGVSIEALIKKTPDIVDLMISFAYSAATNPRSNFNSFNPYPHIEIKQKDPITGVEKTYNFKGSTEFDNTPIKDVIDKCPELTTLQKWVDEGTDVFKEKLNKLHPLLYAFLVWLMASCRTHLKKLDDDELIKDANTKCQYYMVSGTPEREKKFQENKKKYGSTWCFHGSATQNWHSILRIGLKNMSGTSGQLNGAAYGNGIYCAEDSATSVSYIRYTGGWSKSMFGTGSLGCMAVCEVIKHPDLNPNPYWVVKDEDHLATRYFFIYQNSGSSSMYGKSFKPPVIKW